ncbi:MAG: ferritin-like domain-containing protein [Thermoleophilaceae bacterium]|nr:ferritin-like domain-containing protein [Thermoleophilaceae bacterium]
MSTGGRTRREALHGGLTIGGAVLGAATVPGLLRASDAFAQADGDVAILAGAVALEQVAVVAYSSAASSGLLDPRTKRVFERFREQEQEHADGLGAALEQRGGRTPKPPSAAQVPGLEKLRSQAEVVDFAIELETTALAAYYAAVQKLKNPALLETGASIMANEGQHLVVLRRLAGREPVPNAFETGER